MFVVTAACGGATGNPLDDGGTTSDGSSNDAASNDAANAPDTGNGDASAPCPNEQGRYTMKLTGQGCGDTAADASECIQEQSCNVSIDFNSSGSSAKGIKGQTSIAQDGSFTNAGMQEGSANRSGCIGAWNQTASTLTITCGGTNSSQSCVAVLTRVADNCN